MTPTARVLAGALAALACLVCAAPAAGQRCVAPPGTAAIDQYCETIPTARGDRSTLDGAPAPAPGAAVAPPPAGTAPAAAPAPRPSARGRRERRRDRAPRVAARAAQPPASSPVEAIAPAVVTGSTLGGGFLWVLLAATAAVLGCSWAAARRGRRAGRP